MVKEAVPLGYEELYEQWQPKGKQLRDQSAALGRLCKRLAKDMELGDLKAAQRDLSALTLAADAAREAANGSADLLGGFDLTDYLAGGEYARELMGICREKGIDVKAEVAAYEIFPCKIRLDPDAREVVVDKKRLSRARPRALVSEIEAVRARLYAAPFQPAVFAEELAAAYDQVILLQTRKTAPDADIYLQTLYRALTPMRRFRRDYDAQSFAFDLARLYAAEGIVLGDGRKFQFGPSRNSARAVRVLDQEGREQYLATIRFYK